MHSVNRIRLTAATLALAVSASLLPLSRAHASAEGRRNTAYAATAAAAYLGYKYIQHPSSGRAIPAAVAVGAAGYAWQQTSKAQKREHNERAYAERARYYSAGRRSVYRTAGYRGSRGKHYGQRRHCR